MLLHAPGASSKKLNESVNVGVMGLDADKVDLQPLEECLALATIGPRQSRKLLRLGPRRVELEKLSGLDVLKRDEAHSRQRLFQWIGDNDGDDVVTPV